MELVAETTDLETAEDVLSSTYAPVRIHPRGPRRGLRLERAALGPVQFHHVDMAMNFEAEGSPLGMLVFGELTSGLLRQGSDSTDRHYLPGEVFLAAQPGHPYIATVYGAEMQLAVIDPALPSQVADPAPGRTQAPVRFTGYEAISAQARMQWSAACAYVRDHLLAASGESLTPLVAASATRLLIATALATFPNNALTQPTAEDRRDGSTATLHRAVMFIDEYAHQDITIADVAAAAHVTIRAVQLHFTVTSTPPPLAICVASGSTRPIASCSAPTRNARRSAPSPTSGASAAPHGSPATTAAPTASRQAPPCAPGHARQP